MESLLLFSDRSHKRYWANNNGGGQNRPWLLEILFYEGDKLERGGDWFEPVLHIHTFFPHSPPIFLFAPLQLSSQSKYS